jgi:uncharacterized repeat protein (TIGR01451 family)
VKTSDHITNCSKDEIPLAQQTLCLKKRFYYLLLLIVFFATCECLQAQINLVDIGKSYANISKQSTGGTFEPNDTIEIRVTFAVRNVSPSQINNVQLFDTVPSNTSYIPSSIRITTNEGITYKGPYTDALDNTDPASCVAGNIQINLGAGATKSTGGIIKNTDRPSFYGSTCIMVACFRIKVNTSAHYGDTICIGGKVMYKISTVSYTRNFPLYRILLSQSYYNACSNGMSVSTASDSLGTFASGVVQSRPAALAFTTTYSKTNISTGTPNDYSYAIVNNSSADGTINSNSKMPEATALHRVFGLWDIAGDHTGAANPVLGNPPVAPGNRGGYMVLINSSYNTDTAYKETLSNLCPGTFYEFSAWFRNLCPRCGCDSTGKGSGTAGYITGPNNDSSGVRPNINFEIDGLAVYTSGDIRYNRAAPWKKFGFIFLTKPSQSTASFLIRNNSPGGGGNDWAIDDINVAHCGPTLSMNITPVVVGCDAAPFQVNLSDTVRYLYNNSYIYWQWQRSNIGGTVWTNLTGPGTSGVGMPEMVNGQYEYVTNLPSFLANASDSGRYYRVITATTLANLYTSCAYNDGTSTMVKVIHCGVILATEINYFAGQLSSGKAALKWSVSDEQYIKMYAIEKSIDGIHFAKIGAYISVNVQPAVYDFTDAAAAGENLWYRVRIIYNDGSYRYRKIILVGGAPRFEVSNIQNPVGNFINAVVTVPGDGRLNIVISNSTGYIISRQAVNVKKGVNYIGIESAALHSGMYIFSVAFGQELINKKLVKLP